VPQRVSAAPFKLRNPPLELCDVVVLPALGFLEV
jgi:hypothetical protein